MKVIEPYYTVKRWPDYLDLLLEIEEDARTAYKSEDLGGTKESAETVIRKCLTAKPYPHESVIEHGRVSVRFVVDRGVSHELVRHRLASFTQESTRYCNYSKGKFGSEITVIRPCFWKEFKDDETRDRYRGWLLAMREAERAYLALLAAGASAQEARSVLPNSLKTEIVVTANLREWRHIFSLRCDKTAHPQMRQVMRPLLREFKARLPVFFESLDFPEAWDA